MMGRLIILLLLCQIMSGIKSDSPTKAKVFKQIHRFEGYPKKSDVALVEEDLRPIKDGEFLAKALYLSVDPYMRGFANRMPLGEVMPGHQVARIIQSKNGDYPKGKLVVLRSGWRTYTISNGEHKRPDDTEPYLLPDFGKLSPSLAVGALGMPGNTAYFLFLDLCKPQPGETVVVTGAGGAVGSIVGQIAKIKGCKVIGIAGSDSKGDWITKELGFDHFINYKTKDIDQELTRLAPEGVDCYFDNVGGLTASTILKHMNRHGRIAECGRISNYNVEKPVDYSAQNKKIIAEKELHSQGGRAGDYAAQWMVGINQLKTWIDEGKIKYRETITEGFDHMFEAFSDMLHGGNTGKTIVKA